MARRAFDDTSYAAVLQSAELSTTAFGLAVGATRDISSKVTLSALIRKDFTARVNVDSARYGGATSLGADYGLPWTFAGAGLFRVTPLLQVATQAVYRTWAAANQGMVALGAPGASNSLELSVGGELTSRVRRTTQFPLRVGRALRDAAVPDRRGPHLPAARIRGFGRHRRAFREAARAGST